MARIAAPAAVAPTSCTTGDPATDGQTLVVQAPQLDAGTPESLVLDFDACVIPGTAFGTASSVFVTDSLDWYSIPATGTVATGTVGNGTPAPHLYTLTGANTSIDFTGTAISIADTANMAARNGTTGYTIGQIVPYTATITLPEVNPGSNTVSTLPSFDVCVFLPAGLTLDTPLAAPTPVASGEVSSLGTPMVATQITSPSTTADGTDPNCTSQPQLGSLGSGTTLYDLQYPAGTQVNFDGQYGSDTITQTLGVIVGPDPSPSSNIASPLNRSDSETVEASVALSGRSGTLPASASAFYVLEPELSLGVTLSPSSAWTPGEAVQAQIAFTNNDTDGYSTPAFNDMIQLSLPAADLSSSINPSAPTTAIPGQQRRRQRLRRPGLRHGALPSLRTPRRHRVMTR